MGEDITDAAHADFGDKRPRFGLSTATAQLKVTASCISLVQLRHSGIACVVASNFAERAECPFRNPRT